MTGRYGLGAALDMVIDPISRAVGCSPEQRLKNPASITALASPEAHEDGSWETKYGQMASSTRFAQTRYDEQTFLFTLDERKCLATKRAKAPVAEFGGVLSAD